MRVLLLGSGAREHALAKALRSATIYNIASHHNPGIVALAQDVTILPFKDHAAIIDYAKQHQIDMAVIGPEKPLELGLADAFWQVGIPTIGPTKKLAQVESSKGFARDLMQEFHIPGLPRYQRFSKFDSQADTFLKTLKEAYVIKADGLMSGKGVKVAGDHLHSHEEALAFCKAIDGPFVIEEKLGGREFSLLSFTDGHSLAHMPVVQDHKRLLEGDKGLNTGGMGTYTLANHRLAFLTEQDIHAAQAINEAMIAALKTKTGEEYRGILYGGFMKTQEGIKVIEYNARFGDPEAINLLALLETDFLQICEAMLNHTLHTLPISFAKKASVCKYLVPKAYPEHSLKGGNLDISQLVDQEAIYYGSVEYQHEDLIMQGSRALALLCLDETPEVASAKLEKMIKTIGGDYYHRRDIGLT